MEEIRRSPLEVGSLSDYLQGFKISPGGCLGFLNHQQYDWMVVSKMFGMESPRKLGKIFSNLMSIFFRWFFLDHQPDIYRVVKGGSKGRGFPNIP